LHVHVEGTAQMIGATEFVDQAQMRDLLAAIEEKHRLVTVLNACIETPEPVHVQIGVKEISEAGENLALNQRRVHSERFGAGFPGRTGSDAHALRARHDRGGLRGAAFQRCAEQDLRNFWHRRSEKVSEKEVKINLNVNKEDDGANVEPSAEAQAVAAGTVKADAEVAKLGADLEELRQTLLRRQADFDNYRKRVEKERFEDSKRATARVIEGLIPVIDGFEHALAAHREAEYDNYRKGFELIYKQLLDNVAKLGVERIDPVGNLLIRTCTRPWIARKPRITQTGPFCRSFSRVMCFTGACCALQWCV